MGSSSNLPPAGPQGAHSSRGSYGGTGIPGRDAQSLGVKRTGRFSTVASSNDNIQVRIRGKNNLLETKTGSVTRTMDDLVEEKKRRAEINKAANRLKMLEKLEDYREVKMKKEIEQLELERRQEEEELKKAREKEKKYNKYLAQQREKLAQHKKEQTVEDEKKRKKEEDAKKKEAKERKRQ